MSDEEDDFGDFDDFEEFEEAPVDSSSAVVEEQPPQNLPPLKTLHESDFSNSAQLQTAILDILNFDSNTERDQPISEITPAADSTPKSYFSERSESLWNQLAVVTPEVHPIDWKRSSIRRLLLVSMGVPLDLDEFLPKTNTKRLVLPNRQQQQQQQKTTKQSSSSSTSTTASSSSSQDKKAKLIEELVNETEANVSNWYQLAKVSSTAVEGMDDDELVKHHELLKLANESAKALCTKWEQQKDIAQKDKEAFESVIESLVDYAQRVRR